MSQDSPSVPPLRRLTDDTESTSADRPPGHRHPTRLLRGGDKPPPPCRSSRPRQHTPPRTAFGVLTCDSNTHTQASLGPRAHRTPRPPWRGLEGRPRPPHLQATAQQRTVSGHTCSLAPGPRSALLLVASGHPVTYPYRFARPSPPPLVTLLSTPVGSSPCAQLTSPCRAPLSGPKYSQASPVTFY